MAEGGLTSTKNNSEMKYDLKTCTDIHGMPFRARIVDEYLNDNTSDERALTTGQTAGFEVRFEKIVCVCYVRAKVIDLPDVDWFLKEKGTDFVTSRALFSGTEILIPLEYNGRVRLYHRNGGKQYFSVREVTEDFPRYVRVEKDTICASPNVSAPQIVHKGTVLELDRVTKTVQTIRGSRETYLICKDFENKRELAFRLLSPVHFASMPDMTTYVLKDFIQHLPLPQTVEFLDVNPYDVISVYDDDSQDLLVLLSAPLKLLSLQMENFLVGKTVNYDSTCDIVAIPAKDHILKSMFVYLPLVSEGGCHGNEDGSGHYVSLNVISEQSYDCLHQKLYLRFAGEDTLLVVRPQSDGFTRYEVENQSDAPSLPTKSETLLKHAASTEDVQGHPAGLEKLNKQNIRRK